MASGRVGWLFVQSTEPATHIRHKQVMLNEPKTLSNDTDKKIPKLNVTNVTSSLELLELCGGNHFATNVIFIQS
jgi:hypothetical protein